MSERHDDIFDKMDAMLKKHAPQALAPGPSAAPPPEDDIPTLTDVVEPEAEAEFPPVLTDVVSVPLEPDEPVDIWFRSDLPEGVPPAAEAPTAMGPETEFGPMPSAEELAARVKADVERIVEDTLAHQVAPRIAAKLDVALGELLDQFRGEIERLVSESVSRELQQYVETLSRDLTTPPKDQP